MELDFATVASKWGADSVAILRSVPRYNELTDEEAALQADLKELAE